MLTGKLTEQREVAVRTGRDGREVAMVAPSWWSEPEDTLGAARAAFAALRGGS